MKNYVCFVMVFFVRRGVLREKIKKAKNAEM